MTNISTVARASDHANRYGRKFVIVPATILAGLFLLASSCTWFLVGCMMWNVASGVGAAVPTSYVAGAAPSGMNAAAMSAFRMLEDLGYVVGPIALGVASAGVWTWRFTKGLKSIHMR